MREFRTGEVAARELYGDFWFNSEPVPISALRGQVVLVVFWDYTCVHCRRVMPYIKEWNKKYNEFGLTVVGVHTPKFPFGKDPDAVQKAIGELGIAFPVVMDNGALIANNYGNHAWPAIYLIDKNGFVRFEQVGEGNYAAAEHEIQALLYDAGVSEELPLMMEPMREEDRPGVICYRATPDLFTGYLKGSIGNVEGYSPESVVDYADPNLYVEGRFYAVGNWLNNKNSLQFNETSGQTGCLIVKYNGVEVSAVIQPDDEKEFEVTVHQDEKHLTNENKGDDVRIASDGHSYLVIDEPKVYQIVRNREYGEHVLKLSTACKGCSVYSFTFVSCVIPELISNN